MLNFKKAVRLDASCGPARQLHVVFECGLRWALAGFVGCHVCGDGSTVAELGWTISGQRWVPQVARNQPW